MTPDQIRAARALLRWSARVLAERSSVHITTIQRMERVQGVMHGRIATLRKVQAALEATGGPTGLGRPAPELAVVDAFSPPILRVAAACARGSTGRGRRGQDVPGGLVGFAVEVGEGAEA